MNEIIRSIVSNNNKALEETIGILYLIKKETDDDIDWESICP